MSVGPSKPSRPLGYTGSVPWESGATAGGPTPPERGPTMSERNTQDPLALARGGGRPVGETALRVRPIAVPDQTPNPAPANETVGTGLAADGIVPPMSEQPAPASRLLTCCDSTTGNHYAWCRAVVYNGYGYTLTEQDDDRRVASEEGPVIFDPADRKVSRSGDRRQRAVHCSRCMDLTWNVDAVCNRCNGTDPKRATT